MKKTPLILMIFLMLFLGGCNLFKSAEIEKIEIDKATIPAEIFAGELDFSLIKIVLSYSDDSYKNIALVESMLSAEDLAKLSIPGTHTIEVNHNGFKATFTITLKAKTGATFLVKFFNGSELLKEEQVESGKSATAPTNPSKVGHTFKSWDKDFANVTSDLVINAVFEKNKYRVTFLDEDGTTVLKTEDVEYGSSATAPANPTKVNTAEFTYAFDKWDKEFTNITSELSVKAVYKATKNKYKVTFFDEDGTTLLKTEDVDYGTGATAPTNPTKAPTAEFIYIFDKWDKEFSNITSELSVKAVYKATKNKYKVTFFDEDGTTVLKTEDVEYGSSATAPANPTKAPTAEFIYTFDKWDKEFSNITSELSVKAVYKATKNKYKVTFFDEDGTTVLKTEDVEYGSSATAPANPTKANTPEFAYTFDKWDKEYTNITGELSVKAVYKSTKNKYKVTFFDEDGTTVLKTEDVEYGTGATAPANPTKVPTAEFTYTFDKWDIDFTIVTSELNVKAVYKATKNQYKVTFFDDDGVKVINTEYVEYGNSATAPANPTKVPTAEFTYTFDKWDIDFTNVTSELNVKAVYKKTVNKYTVTFYNGTTLIKTESVEYGSKASAPEPPFIDGYEFDKWDKDFSVIYGNLEVYAIYKPVQINTENYVIVTNATGKVGDEVTVEVWIKGIVKFNGYEINIQYDTNVLQLVSTTNVDISANIVGTNETGFVKFNHLTIKNYTQDSCLLQIKFRILDTYQETSSVNISKSVITFNNNNMPNYAKNTTKSGQVTIN